MIPPSAAVDPTKDQKEKPAEEVNEQRERLGVTLFSIGDAVIATDAVGRVTLLNPMAESLTGWAEEDAKDQPIEAVFRIVNDATRHPVHQPVKSVIEHGIIQSLA